MINSKPDAVFCSTNGPTQAIFAKQLRQLGFNKLCLTVRGYRLIQLMWQEMQSTTGYLLIHTWYTAVLKKQKILK